MIVGGGIGGLTAALALQHHGVACEVYERAPELHEIGSGVGLWPGALRVLDRLGVGDAVRALTTRWELGGIRAGDGRFLVRYSGDHFARIFGERLAGVHRGELQQVLLRALPDGTVHTGHECVGVDAARAGAVVRFATGVDREARAVIGADGQRSVVRTTLFSDHPLNDTGITSWRGTVATQPGWDTPTGETWGPGAVFGFLPISGGRLTWFGAEADAPAHDKGYLLERFGDWHAPIRQVIAATDDDQIWHDRIFDRRPLRRWVRGPVALLGDAAHPMTPAFGQGACQAIRDAWALGESLGSTSDVPAALRAYERRRRTQAVAVTGLAHLGIASARRKPRALQAASEAVTRAIPAGVVLRAMRPITGG